MEVLYVLEDERQRAEEHAVDGMTQVLKDFNREFGEKIGDLDSDPGQERIFLLEDMLQDAQRQTNSLLLEYTQGLIESIDEKELIRRKKANMKAKG